MTEILASEILAVTRDMSGLVEIVYRDLTGDYTEAPAISPSKTFAVTAVYPGAGVEQWEALHRERDVLEAERDKAIANREELEVALYDAHERLAWEKKRADDAEAAVREWELEADTRWRYVGGPGVTA